MLAICLASLADGAAFAQVTLHHRLDVRIQPEAGRIEARDAVRLPEPLKQPRSLAFALSPDLRVTGAIEFDTGATAEASDQGAGRYRVAAPAGAAGFTVRYQGVIRHALEDVSDSPGKSQFQSRGHIGAEGVFLDGGARWYPRMGDERVTFDLNVDPPAGWLAVSQGAPVGEGEASGRREPHPQEEIYLVANRFHRYRQKTPEALAEVYLRHPDEALARNYLDATQRYLSLYSGLIGPYSYAKFALVENFWETGYGMPSFTLLGPRVIRLPFIIHTAYPHEILHNWFGNGVYVDYSQGNWSEGLTSYLSDHLLRERRGKGADYRREALQRYADYVKAEGEFPLKSFTARHGDASQAIGYGKAMMVFHSLRRRLGDEAFFKGLRIFYRQHRFQRAGYTDLQRAWEQASGQDLGAFFRQWLNRTGAPRLAISGARVERREGKFILTGLLGQTQPEAPFELRIPLRVETAGGEPIDAVVPMTQREKRFRLSLDARPIRLRVDPDFDLFRRLDPAEIPPTLSRFFGESRATIVVPSSASPRWRRLAEQWASRRSGQWRIVTDDKIDALPKNGGVLLLGAENRFIQPALRQTTAVGFRDGRIEIEGKPIPLKDKSLALTLPGPVVIVMADPPEAIDGLARKLPHYGKYSYLVFGGANPDIETTGRWRVEASPLVVDLG